MEIETLGSQYQCPMCGKVMDRNLILFLDHAKQHIIDRIKQEHPEWVAENGICQPCTEYYERQLSGEWRDTNIGPRERLKRRNLAIGTAVLSGGLALLFILAGWPRFLRVALFFPVFFSVLCFLEERGKTCVVLAELGRRNMDQGNRKIEDCEIVAALKTRARNITLKSLAWTLLVTALLFLLP